MTIPAGQTPLNNHTANGVTAAWNYTFKIGLKTDLLVTTTDTLGVVTTHVVDVDYTVTGVGVDAGGQVVFVTPPTNLHVIAIEDNPPTSQIIPFATVGDFRGSLHENAFDKVTRVVRKADFTVNRAIHLPTAADPLFSGTMPLPAGNGGKLLALAADALGVQYLSAADVDLALVTAYMQTLLLETTAAAARANLGIVEFGRINDHGFSVANGTDADHDLDIGAGGCWDSTSTEYITYAAATIVCDALWSGAGNLDTGVIPASDILYLYVTHDAAQANSIVVCSTSATWAGVTKQSGFTLGRRIGAVSTDASNNLHGFDESAGHYRFTIPLTQISTTAWTQSVLTLFTCAAAPAHSVVFGNMYVANNIYAGNLIGGIGAASESGNGTNYFNEIGHTAVNGTLVGTLSGAFAMRLDANQQMTGSRYALTGIPTANVGINSYMFTDRFSEV